MVTFFGNLIVALMAIVAFGFVLACVLMLILGVVVVISVPILFIKNLLESS